MTKAEIAKQNAKLIEQYLKKGGKVTQLPPQVVKASRLVRSKYDSIAHVGRKQITVARMLVGGV